MGTGGVSGSRSWTGKVTLFSFPFGPVPLVTLNLKVGGDVGVSFSVDFQGTGQLSLSAGLKAYGDATAGDPSIIGLQGGIAGTFLSGTLSAAITNGVASRSCSFTAGQLSAFVEGSIAGHKFSANRNIFDGWSTGRCY